MTAIEPLLRQPAAQAIAWALLQFIWQGALIALLTAAALAMLKRSAADVRYVVATIGLSLMLTMPVVTALQSWRPSSEGASGNGTSVTTLAAERSPSAGSDSGVPPAAGSTAIADLPVARAAIVDGGTLSRLAIEPWLPMLLLAWLTGVALLTLRLMSGWLWIQRLKTHGAAADDGWQRMARRLCRRLHITRGVRLLESSLVEVPTVIGWIKPVILLPGSTLAGLSPQQLEAILAHELAHIRRHDYVVNLMQTLVETLLFYHPAVWWLSRRIRVERENCCDDLAVSLCGDPYTYARALAELEERRGTCGHLALAATGGSLLHRIRRLLGAPTSHAGRGPGWLAGTAVVLVMAGIVAGALGDGIMRAQRAAAEPVVAQAERSPAAATAPVVSTPATAERAPATIQPTPAARERAAAPVLAAAEAMRSTPRVATAPEDRARVMASAVTPVLEPTIVAPAAIAGTTSAPRQPVERAAPVLKSSQETVGTFTWSTNGEKLQVDFRGEVEFTDDDTDVKRLSPGGHLKIKDGRWLGGRTVEFRADPSGKLERRFWVGMSERPFEPEGRQWLAQALPRFIRQTGLGAESRVARILKSGGPAGVLAEISRIEGSWAKRVYFRHLIRQAPLDSPGARQVLAQAGREIDSDFELASLLIDAADKLIIDEPARKAYFDAARSIDSDFEMRRVYASALQRGPVSAPLIAGVLDASRSIESDFEQAALLTQIIKQQPLDQTTSKPFFGALAGVDSDFEHRRVLSMLAARSDLSPEIAAAILDSAITLESDFELASLLVQIAKDHGTEGVVRQPFFRALESVDSAFERSRVLQTLASRAGISGDTILAILKSVRGVNSSHEASQVLLSVASAHAISGPARDLYIDAAEKLGDYEQGKVLTALVKSERRK